MGVKRIHFLPRIPDWERDALTFCPLDISKRHIDNSYSWVNYRGEFILPPENMVLAEEIVENDIKMGLEDLCLRNPNQFVAGNLHSHLTEWENLELDVEAKVWLKEGVNVEHYFKKFKGNFKGKSYDCATPQRFIFLTLQLVENLGSLFRQLF